MKRLIWVILAVLLLCGCSNSKNNGIVNNNNITPMPTKKEEATKKPENGNVSGKSFEGIILKIDDEAKKLYLRQLEEGSEYELSYTGATDVRNSYDEIIIMKQLTQGEIVEAVYEEQTMKLKSVKTSAKAFKSSNIMDFHADYTTDTITFGSGVYHYDEFLTVFSEGNLIEPSQVIKKDKVTVWGIDNKIYSVVVNEGHGYIRFTGYDPFIGGMVEIGRSFLYKVTDNMMITVPEGEYKITMSCGKLTGSKTVQISRDMSAVVDFSEFRPEVIKTGTVNFDILPKTAVLYINNKKTDYREPVHLDYGQYSIRVTCNGFDDYTESFKVDQIYTTKEIHFEEESGAQEPTSETKTAQENQTQQTTQGSGGNVQKPTEEGSGNGNLIIESPVGVDVYIDAIYVGKTPLTIKKDPGEHIITFYKSGYETKSYAIDVSKEDADQKLAFPEMNED